ncbi:MAG: hypothetical protein CMJ99_09380 [Planctomycetes bacterium]|nr:hypothetical protein [Planctomycetota bacterium]
MSVFFSVLTCLVYNSINEVEQVPAAGDESGIRELVRRLDSIQARLESLSVTVEELPRGEMPSTPAVAARAEPPAGAEAGEKPAEKSLAAPAASTGERLAALLELKGGEEDIRQYVTGIIEDDRNSQKTLQRQRQAERRAMFRGPYGRHNFQVNSLAGKLDLGDGQKEKYHELLQHYGKEAELLRKGPEGRPFWELENPEQIAAHVKNMEQQRKNLGERLDNEFVQFLEQDQARTYLDLPEDERGLGGGMGVFHHVEVGDDGAPSVQLHIESSKVIGLGDISTEIDIAIPPIAIPPEAPGNEDE